MYWDVGVTGIPLFRQKKEMSNYWDVRILGIPFARHKPAMSNYWDVGVTGIPLFRQKKRYRTKGMSEYWESHLSDQIQDVKLLGIEHWVSH